MKGIKMKLSIVASNYLYKVDTKGYDIAIQILMAEFINKFSYKLRSN